MDDSRGGDPSGDGEPDIEALISDRRAASPRKTPGRAQVGSEHTPRYLALTIAAIALATLVLVLVILLGRA